MGIHAGCARSPMAPTASQASPAMPAADAERADPEARVREWDARVRATPDRVPAHLRLVSHLIALGRRSEARERYVARSRAPDARVVDRILAMRLTSDGSPDALRRVYSLATQQAPESPWWHLALAEVEIADADRWHGERERAVARGDRTAERAAHDEARDALRRAQAALRQAEQRAPRLAEVAAYEGYLRATEGDLHASATARTAAWRAAEAAFVLAVQRDPALVEAWRGLADVRYRSGDEGRALEAALEAVRLDPGDGTCREVLGIVLHAIGRHAEAARQYEHAARLHPWDAAPLIRLGSAHADDERWTQALEAWRRALSRDPEAVEAHYKRGTVLEHLGRRAEARASFERYVEQGGPRAAAVRRRIDRLLREDA